MTGSNILPGTDEAKAAHSFEYMKTGVYMTEYRQDESFIFINAFYSHPTGR
jgi:hypothetical protein